MLAAAGLGRIHSAFLPPACLDAEVLGVEVVAGDDVALAEVGLARVLDLDAAASAPGSCPRNSNLSMTEPGSRPVSPTRLDPHLAEHLGDDDLQVLVVDLDALRAVDVLDLAEEVALDGLLAGDPEDVVRDERPLDQRVAGADAVAAVDAEVLAVGDEVLALDRRSRS